MQYKDHECIVFLSGNLSEMPIITADWTNNAFITVTRKYSTSNSRFKKESYRVIINQYDTARIIQSGYLNMSIIIHGELRIDEKAEIIANKVEFFDFPNSNQPASIIQKKPELKIIQYH